MTDVYVAKLDAAGNDLWSKTIGDDAVQVATSVAIDGSDDIVLAGTFFGSVDFGGGPLASAGGEVYAADSESELKWSGDIFLTKLDGAGNFVWNRGSGDARAQAPRGVTTAADGSIANFDERPICHGCLQADEMPVPACRELRERRLRRPCATRSALVGLPASAEGDARLSLLGNESPCTRRSSVSGTLVELKRSLLSRLERIDSVEIDNPWHGVVVLRLGVSTSAPTDSSDAAAREARNQR